MPRALILGGTGLIGRATAARLLASGWQVDVTGRDPANLPAPLAEAGARFIGADRSDARALAAALGAGADLLVDCLSYTAADAELLLPVLGSVTSTVMISSKAVYTDASGNHSNSPVAPRFGGPVREDQSTMSPGHGDHDSREGYGANKVAAEHVLLDSGAPVSVLRPSRIHGVGAGRPREWMFVKRALDRRPAVFFADGGRGTVHTTAAANIAALIETAASRPGRRILNSADPDAPSALEILRIIADRLGWSPKEIFLDEGEDEDGEDGVTRGAEGSDTRGDLGRHAWESPYPYILDTTASVELGYTPAGDYATTVADEIDWLVDAANAGGGTELLSALEESYFGPLLDYDAEDRYTAQHGL